MGGSGGGGGGGLKGANMLPCSVTNGDFFSQAFSMA